MTKKWKFSIRQIERVVEDLKLLESLENKNR